MRRDPPTKIRFEVEERFEVKEHRLPSPPLKTYFLLGLNRNYTPCPRRVERTCAKFLEKECINLGGAKRRCVTSDGNHGRNIVQSKILRFRGAKFIFHYLSRIFERIDSNDFLNETFSKEKRTV